MAKRQRNVLALRPEQAAYIAGLIDGEGSVTLSRKHRGENRQVCVSISSTEQPLLAYVLRHTGVGKITNKRATSPRHRPSQTYAVWNRHALDVLRQVFPYLQSYKRLRAALLLEHYMRLTPRNGKYTDELRAERKAFERRVLGTKPA